MRIERRIRVAIEGGLQSKPATYWRTRSFSERLAETLKLHREDNELFRGGNPPFVYVIKQITLLAWLVFMPTWAEAQGQKITCDWSGSQTAMNQCAGNDLAQADRELDRVWKNIQTKYADQPLFLEKLKTAQRLWLQFRDAELDVKFPLSKGESPTQQYGTVFSMCAAEYEAGLIQNRIRDLKVWLAGGEEGDVCLGSVKQSNELMGAK